MREKKLLRIDAAGFILLQNQHALAAVVWILWLAFDKNKGSKWLESFFAHTSKSFMNFYFSWGLNESRFCSFWGKEDLVNFYSLQNFRSFCLILGKQLLLDLSIYLIWVTLLFQDTILSFSIQCYVKFRLVSTMPIQYQYQYDSLLFFHKHYKPCLGCLWSLDSPMHDSVYTLILCL